MEQDKGIREKRSQKNPLQLEDLSHCQKWILQDKEILRFNPFGMPVPEYPGVCIIKSGVLVCRMNSSEALILQIENDAVKVPKGAMYTCITDSLGLLMVKGESLQEFMERVTHLDLFGQGCKLPCLIQGPLLEITCQIIILWRNHQEVVLIAFPRGYLRSITKALLEEGEDLGISPLLRES
jgi:hypothetical protein